MEFQNGSRVRYMGNKYPNVKWKYGTVVGSEFSTHDGHHITNVDWDEEVPGGWDCNGRARDKHGWNVRTCDLQLITECGAELLDRFARGEIAIDISSDKEGNDLIAWVYNNIPNSHPDPCWYSDDEYEDYPLVYIKPRGYNWSGHICDGAGDEAGLPDRVKDIFPYGAIAPYLNGSFQSECDIEITKLNLEEVL